VLRALASIRASERRDTWLAFATLLGLVASHTILETARDGLFLSRLPATRLPYVYMAIAAVSLVLGRLQSGLFGRLSGRAALCASLALAAAGTLSFVWLLPALGTAALYLLYIWSGVLTTLVLVHLWTLLGELFSVSQAKRLYGIIGAGSVTGALAGSGMAGVLAELLSPSALLSTSAVLLACTTGIATRFTSSARLASERVAAERLDTGPRVTATAGFVLRQPYSRRVVLLLSTAAAALTVADFLFKSQLAAAVPRDELTTYFAVIGFALNLLSLVCQLVLVTWVVRRFDLATALSVLPAALIAGGVLAMTTGGLVAALAIKGADGALRYSLHRTAGELLLVPLGDSARRWVKTFVDTFGSRGGQALASLAILAAAALALPPWALGAALLLLCTSWLVMARDLRHHYVQLFRSRLHQGHGTEEFPELDVASLETLIATLDSSRDEEVLAAMNVLERERKVRLIPGLILYHPSERVIEAALALFVRVGRRDIAHTAYRLLEHPSPRVRAAAVTACATLEPDENRLRMRLSLEESPEVRATIMVNLVVMGAIVGGDARDALAHLKRHGSPATCVALAEAIARSGAAERFADDLIELARSLSSEVRAAAARAMAGLRAPVFLPVLVDMLGSESTRAVARDALFAHGPAGLEAVAAALVDTTHHRALRWELPRAVARFESQEAVDVLLHQLPEELDGMVRYRILRALEMLTRRVPSVRLSPRVLRRTIDDTVSRAYRYLDRRLVLERGARAEAHRRTPGHALLCKLLRDKEQNAIGRLFRLLALLHPKEDFAAIYRGLRSPRREQRDSSIELCENLLEPPLRGAVVGLIDDADDEQRIAARGPYHPLLELDYEALLGTLLASSSAAVQDITAFHIGELGLRRFRGTLAALPASARRRSDIARVLALLEGTPIEETAHAG
jgi:AAA family ATP:ADP antiporter